MLRGTRRNCCWRGGQESSHVRHQQNDADERQHRNGRRPHINAKIFPKLLPCLCTRGLWTSRCLPVMRTQDWTGDRGRLQRTKIQGIFHNYFRVSIEEGFLATRPILPNTTTYLPPLPTMPVGAGGWRRSSQLRSNL